MTKKKLDIVALAELAQRIADRGRHDLVNFQHELETEHGLKAVEKPKGSSFYTVKIAGVGASSTGGFAQALENWANAARREIAKAGG